MVITSGEGLIQVAPDRAWITIAAETRGPSAKEAQQRNTEAMRPVQDALRKAGLSAEVIRTVGYDLQQEFDFVNNRRVSRGYVARNSIEVRVDDVSRLGELLELSVGQGATTVHGLRFDLKDRARLEREALRQAVADWRGPRPRPRRPARGAPSIGSSRWRRGADRRRLRCRCSARRRPRQAAPRLCRLRPGKSRFGRWRLSRRF